MQIKHNTGNCIKIVASWVCQERVLVGLITVLAVFCLGVWISLKKFPDSTANVANVVSIVSAFLAFITSAVNLNENYKKRTSDNQLVTIFIENTDEKDKSKKYMKTFLSLKRGDVSRSELMGLVGMLFPERFDIEYFRTPDCFEAIQKLKKGKTDKLILPCTAAQIDKMHSNALEPTNGDSVGTAQTESEPPSPRPA